MEQDHTHTHGHMGEGWQRSEIINQLFLLNSQIDVFEMSILQKCYHSTQGNDALWSGVEIYSKIDTNK